MTPNGNLYTVGMDKDGKTGSSSNFNDFYRLDPDTGAVLQAWVNVFPDNGFRHVNALSAESDTSLLAIEGGGVCPSSYPDGPKLLRINLDGAGDFLSITNLGTIRAPGAESHCSDGDLDRDPATGKWYAGFYASDGSEMVELNLANPSASTLGSQSNIQYQGGFAFLSNGTAYAGCWADKKLYTVNVISGGSAVANDLSASLAGNIFGLSSVPPTEVWVATTGNDTNLGTQAQPFKTIQRGINAVAVGGTVNVAAGTYTESYSSELALKIDKPISLIGTGLPTVDGNSKEKVVQVTADDVTISGMKFLNANAGAGVGIYLYNVDDTVISSCESSNNEIGLLLAGVNYATIDGNTLSDNTYRSIVIQQNSNGNIVKGNTITMSGNDTLDGIVIGSDSGDNVIGAESQPNTINIPQSTTLQSGAVHLPRAIYLTGEVASDNVIKYNNIDGSASAIQIDGNTGTTTTVDHNTIGQTIAPSFRGVQINGGSLVLTNNTIKDSVRPVEFWGAVNVTITDNTIDGTTFDFINIGSFIGSVSIKKNAFINIAGQGLNNRQVGTSVDASPNWWGSITGPAAGQIVGDVDYDPWCGDEACSFTVSANEGDGDYYINAAGQIVLSGNVSIDGGIVVNEPGLTFLLTDGTIIENNSPCFTVNADNTKITTESIGGATCVPTNDSNGIDVAGGLTDIIIEGIEIDGSDQDTGDGIHFAGGITDVILRDNFIHDLDGDGVAFSETPAGTVQVQGNLFMDNVGVGVEAPSDLDVTYNAWGHMDGPAFGDGVSTNIDSDSYTDWTHVDLYMESSGTDVTDEVREGETITYTIYANLQRATGADFKLSFDPALLEVSSTTLGTVFTDPATGGDVVTTDNAAGEIHFAGGSAGGSEQSGAGLTLFAVTFTAKEDGVSGLAFAEDDFAMSPPSGPSNNIYAAALTDGSVEIRNHYTVTGTVSMQGRTVRLGVSFTLTSNTGILWGPFQTLSTAPISDNVFLNQVVENEYQITIEQDRYLDLVTASGKLLDVTADLVLNPIELFGGDVNNSDAISLDDASIVGGDYYETGDIDGDANFDDIVNIFDLALVGGNYGLESATAYDTWTP
jgi:parallel beta-helix repeat protein